MARSSQAIIDDIDARIDAMRSQFTTPVTTRPNRANFGSDPGHPGSSFDHAIRPPPLTGPFNRTTQELEPERQATEISTLVDALSQILSRQNIGVNLPKLPTFTGDVDSMEFNMFLENFDEILSLNGWDHLESEQKASLLRSSLTKRAADAFNGLPTPTKHDYERARAELTRIFMNPAKIVLFQNEFDNKVQGEKETLQELVTALRRLARRGYPEVAADSEKILRQKRSSQRVRKKQLDNALQT